MFTKAALVVSIILGFTSIFYGIYCILGETSEEWVTSSMKTIRLVRLKYHHLDTLNHVASVCLRDSLVSNRTDRIELSIKFNGKLSFMLKAEGPIDAIPECVIQQLLVLRGFAKGHLRTKQWKVLCRRYIEYLVSRGLSYTPPT
jgi:hypothetical protein